MVNRPPEDRVPVSLDNDDDGGMAGVEESRR
jgi:hypothetical protein